MNNNEDKKNREALMAKTVTLRLSDDVYEKFSSAAKAERRSISNLIEVLALKRMEEDLFVDRIEMEEILADQVLMARLQRGAKEVKQRKGRYVE
jgi:predicted CopG family antitoxin